MQWKLPGRIMASWDSFKIQIQSQTALHWIISPSSVPTTRTLSGMLFPSVRWRMEANQCLLIAWWWVALEKRFLVCPHSKLRKVAPPCFSNPLGQRMLYWLHMVSKHHHTQVKYQFKGYSWCPVRPHYLIQKCLASQKYSQEPQIFGKYWETERTKPRQKDRAKTDCDTSKDPGFVAKANS